MAHASVASLMRTIESLLISSSPMQSLICDHRGEFCALHEKVSSLEVFLNNFEKNNVSGEMTDLEVQVKKVANAVEYTIQLRLTEIVIAKNKSQNKRTRQKFRHSLEKVAKDIDCVWKESSKIQDKGKQVSKESLVQDFSSSTKDILNDENNMVGRDDQRERLLEDLTISYSGEPKVIPIVGMGGIGKTTLVKEVYNDKSILYRFDVRAWATVSQQHNVKNILLSLLHSTIKMDDTVKRKGEAELKDMLQKSLKGKRYLIVMDDIWSSKAWDDVRRCFPSENNAGSRILLTTRNNEVACYADTENLSLQMDFMDPDESWNLFKNVAFADEALPSEFVTIGKQIAEKCHGLPLTIVVVAGLLKSKGTIEDWESVAKDVKSFVTKDPDGQCSHVLGLSYNHLSSDLKTCLLYFGIFPEDTEIPVKNLMRIWMAEGFLNLEKDLEVEAEKCLQDLIDRCLVLVSKKSLDETNIRSCKVHDLIYDLCLREVQRGNVFLMNDVVFEKSDAKKAQRHEVVFDCEPNHVPLECQSLSRHKMQPFKRWTDDEIRYLSYGVYRALLTPEHHQLTDNDNNNLLKRTRSIFFCGCNNNLLKRTRSIFFCGRYASTFILKSELIHFKLLKHLDLSHIMIKSFPLQILSLIWLRYLSLRCHEYFDIPPEICGLWNLQTFIVKGCLQSALTFPEKIWGLMQLRHLELDRLILPNRPSVSVDKGRHMGFSNIQTISYLSLCCCTKEVISGIKNVKKLGISGDLSCSDSPKMLPHQHRILKKCTIFGGSDKHPSTFLKSTSNIGGDEDDYESFRDSGLFNNLVHLHQLETLSLSFYSDWKPFISPGTSLSVKSFPATLKKLKLNGTYLSWSYLDIIAELPNLEVLKLMYGACCGKEWYPNVRGFTRLKLLLIQFHYNLEYWKATNDNFPILERLVIRDCPYLKEIPIEFADIHSLQLIELRWCNPELEASAARIQLEQEGLGNKPMDVRIINKSRRSAQ